MIILLLAFSVMPALAGEQVYTIIAQDVTDSETFDRILQNVDSGKVALLANGTVVWWDPWGAIPDQDSDGDGVPEDIDQCPGTPAGVAVDDKGCPICPICPIGGSAPLLRNPGILSGSLCRGACGSDCSTCTAQPNRTICVPDATGNFYYNCTYGGVVSCPTHLCCRKHDDCFDDAVAIYGEIDEVKGSRHAKCNADCLSCVPDGGWINCSKWLLGEGPLDPVRLNFSDPPILTGPFPGPCPI